MRRPLHVALALVVCLALAGCYQKQWQDGGLTVSFAPWVPLLVIFGGLLAIPAGIAAFLWQHRFWGVILVVAGVAATLVIAPGMFLDRVTINNDGFYSRHGFWFSPQTHQIPYRDLDRVLVVEEVTNTRRGGKSYSYSLDCFFKNRPQERVPLGDLMRESLPEIAQQFRAHGVPIILPPNMQQ